MKRLIPILLILALALALGGCGDFAPDPTETPGTTVEYSFDRSNFQTIAGGEAQRPLAEAIAAIMLGETRESASDMLSFGSTGEAWAALESGEAGLVLAAEPDELPEGVECTVRGEGERRVRILMNHNARPVTALGRELGPFGVEVIPI